MFTLLKKLNHSSLIKNNKKRSALAALVATTTLLAGCGDNNGDDGVVTDQVYRYQVTVTNLTHNQPLSPVTHLIHGSDYQAWSIGSMASEALEQLAESGDNSAVLDNAMITESQASEGVVMPGLSYQTTLELSDKDHYLTILSMLVNTNDAFTGLNKHALTNYSVGDKTLLSLRVYDAGTESNSELQATIPGPAGQGEGFNVQRDDTDFVSMHPGVVSMDDGLSTSVLNESHRIESVVAQVVIERLQ
ncbi:spondin domain-containing protein [Psychrobium sp. 1_MG-2023]|uniref:spondin domain-containing protein n=1 Tax=Psychrobium sp. 1_MG-2023 TaxID=3062624 RepID=UPI000C32CAF2|nr:spondin domain-containing protein [Psychrobium sp. 1_MG-2023]MDP2561713.1 spondin domain-containing protein [Psychrobium sp. 1_MG-2023]PKF57113.1 hypothetical protein CW748_08485 [Alteromonadales bacterium alter-6D02]